MNIWKWLTTPDPTPGLNPRKMGRLMLKAFLFALVVVVIQSLLRLTGLKFVASWWFSALLVIALYIPFARFLAVDMMPPPRRSAAPVNASKAARQAKAQYAGVKKGPPRQKRS